MAWKFIYEPERWHDFFLMVGTGAAALTGLLVVAMSIHLEVITKDPVLRHRALSILAGLAAVFMRCALVLMGGQNHQAVGCELLIVSAIVSGIGIKSSFKVFGDRGISARSSQRRTVGSESFYLVEMLGASMLVFGYAFGLYVAAVAMVANFYYWISGSWLLLVGISWDEER